MDIKNRTTRYSLATGQLTRNTLRQAKTESPCAACVSLSQIFFFEISDNCIHYYKDYIDYIELIKIISNFQNFLNVVYGIKMTIMTVGKQRLEWAH